MKQRIWNYMKQFHMVKPKDRVVVGLSGGADSVFLLWVLKELESDLDITLEALHFHHGLREASDGEEIFVRQLCERWNIPCKVVHLDVKEYAKMYKMGIEEAARTLRYEAFEREVASIEHTKIALAHHQNDQAETVLYQMVRGSDARGLTGMRPVRDHLIRPLLCVSREQIEAVLAEQDIAFVTDESNADNQFTRNYIRNQVLVDLKNQVNERAIQHIADCSASMAEMVDFMDQMVADEIKELVLVKESQVSIPRASLHKLHPFMQKRLIYEMLCMVAGHKKDVLRVHVNAVVELLAGQSGRSVDLVYGMQALVDQQFLIIQRIDGADTNLSDDVLSSRFSTRIFPYQEDMIIPEDRYTKWLDYDKMGKQLVYRIRQEKDFLYVGEGCKKKLKSFFVDEKIPLSIRDQVLLVADDTTSEIYWVVGYRINHNYKITKDTKQIIEITYHEEND